MGESAVGDRADRLGLILWEYHFSFPLHTAEDERIWCAAHPEFADEIRGFSRAARAYPLPNEWDETPEEVAELEAMVKRVLNAADMPPGAYGGEAKRRRASFKLIRGGAEAASARRGGS